MSVYLHLYIHICPHYFLHIHTQTRKTLIQFREMTPQLFMIKTMVVMTTTIITLIITRITNTIRITIAITLTVVFLEKHNYELECSGYSMCGAGRSIGIDCEPVAVPQAPNNVKHTMVLFNYWNSLYAYTHTYIYIYTLLHIYVYICIYIYI